MWLHATERIIEVGWSLYTLYIRFEVRIAAEKSPIEAQCLRTWSSTSAGSELSNEVEVLHASIVVIEVRVWRYGLAVDG